MSILDQRRVKVRCRNEACGWGHDDDSPMQRLARKWDAKPCPRCGCAVELCPGVTLDPLELEPLPGLELVTLAVPPRSPFDGLRVAPMQLLEVCSVSVRTLRVLNSNPQVPNNVRAEQILEEWAKGQPDPPGWS